LSATVVTAMVFVNPLVTISIVTPAHLTL